MCHKNVQYFAFFIIIVANFTENGLLFITNIYCSYMDIGVDKYIPSTRYEVRNRMSRAVSSYNVLLKLFSPSFNNLAS
jgi:hypothetical protein